ncbi:MAG: DNA alkylation repair protein [Planctomycetes bacterium]|nr:DNA alkylation repair protein [Planctomycetota bacterium]
MAEYTLKSFFSPGLVRRLAGEIARVHPKFARNAFIAGACKGLDALELLDRGRHIARVLYDHLPPSYPEAVDVLLRSLGPEHATDELLGVGLAPFFYLPHTMIVAERGLDHFDLSMRAQYELTKRFSAEASIRPYIKADPERVFAVLRGWARDKNAHVRRLVSEGTRLRLPWAMRVPWLDANPQRVLALLELLKDDPASVVRRSVANSLNDLGKVYPELLNRTCAAWLKDASAERRALVEHALRGAIKRGDGAALKLLGFGGKAAVSLENVRFEPRKVVIGGKVRMTFELRSTASKPQELLVDVAVHFRKKSGGASPKVLKLKRLTLPAKGTAAFETRFSLAVHTTRVPQPGKHAVDVLVNGSRLPAGSFHVRAR